MIRNIIHYYSFNFNIKLNWKFNSDLYFLIKLRAMDIKVKSNIFERIKNLESLFDDRQVKNSNLKSCLWLDYYKKTYKDNFCEPCKKFKNVNIIEDINHLFNCSVINNNQNLFNLQDNIYNILIEYDENINNIPLFFLNKPSHIKFKMNNWKFYIGLLGFIPVEFIYYLKNNKIYEIHEIIIKIQCSLSNYVYNRYESV